jgi:hypothetical protein
LSSEESGFDSFVFVISRAKGLKNGRFINERQETEVKHQQSKVLIHLESRGKEKKYHSTYCEILLFTYSALLVKTIKHHRLYLLIISILILELRADVPRSEDGGGTASSNLCLL